MPPRRTESSVKLSTGTVRGDQAEGVRRFLGIPYAAAPIGDLRFAEPAPVAPWVHERDATTPGATAPQYPYDGGMERFLGTTIVPGDDFLNLNVWAPAKGSRLPVMVWIHGGSFIHGSNALDAYDGTTFARDGIVFVAINYRLGAEGFSVLDGAPTNLGIADQLAALRWVQTEIAAFGGDPAKVTVFGESAGGSSVATLLAHPDARSLFTRAVVQSGPLSAKPAKEAGRISRLMAKKLGIKPTRDAFAAKTPQELLDAQKAVMAGSNPIMGGPGFAPSVGGAFVPRNPEEALQTGAGRDIPLMIGATSEEYRLWFMPSGLMDRVNSALLLAARAKFGIGRRVYAPYRRNRPDASPGEMLGVLATDVILRLPLTRLADARLGRGAATWVYEFAWRSPVEDLGAAHAMELGFVFDGLARPDSIALAGDDAPQSLADAMHAAWVAFATHGDPGWRRWNEKRPVQVFDEEGAHLVEAPREDERSAWPR